MPIINQHKQIAPANGPPRERTWQVDEAAAAQVMGWSRRAPALLAQELGEMAEHFPHWLLASTLGERLRRCAPCGELIVFAEGAARCVRCDQPAPPEPAARLAWVGHLPSLLPPGLALAAPRAALAAVGAPSIEASGAQYLLVPLLVTYPESWQNNEPLVRYGPGVLHALGLPEGPSGQFHLYGASQACLYAPGQWRGASVRVVLQQRVVNHVASLLKIAAGVPPETAFIGRIH